MTKISEKAVATKTTNDIDQTLAIMISTGFTGVTIRCSSVPRSRSRISAAPVRISAIIAMLLTRPFSAPSHTLSRLGLKRLRISTSAEYVTPAGFDSVKKLLTSRWMICWM